MTKQYRFMGDPDSYQWDFRPQEGFIYPGTKEAFRRHSIGELVEAAKRDKDRKFLEEWKEVGDE